MPSALTIVNLGFTRLAHADKQAHLRFALKGFTHECMELGCEPHDPCHDDLVRPEKHAVPPENP